MTSVFVRDNRLCLSTSYQLKELCKTIPGARWDAALKCWTYPATPGAASSIRQAFPNEQTAWSEEATGLVRQAEEIVSAQSVKQAEILPEIPLTKTKPWHHQKQAFWFAEKLPACMLALDMGTGKSKVAVDLLVNRHCRRVLICCPKSVVAVWPFQFGQHSAAPFRVVALDDGTIAARARDAANAVALAEARGESIVIVVNYEAAWMRELGHWIMGQVWDAVVLDESHRIKQPGGKAALFFGRLGDRASFKLCLTGTPCPHSPLDLYGQYRFLDKGIFGTSFTMFRARYAVLQQIGANIAAKKVIGFQNQDELQRKMYSIAFRVKAEDVQDLPEIVDVIRTVKLGREALRVYGQLKQEFVTDYGNGQITAGNALTRLLRLQQITTGWVKHDDNVELGTPGALVRVDRAKEQALQDILEDLAEREPAVVFCRFRRDLQTVHEVAAKFGRQSLELSGDRNELARWQAGEAPILAIQIQSGGVGIDLTRSRYAVYFSLSFSLGDYLQSRKRIHRPGQTRSCTVIHLVAEKTVDQQIYAALEAREEVVNAILQQGVL